MEVPLSLLVGVSALLANYVCESEVLISPASQSVVATFPASANGNCSSATLTHLNHLILDRSRPQLILGAKNHIVTLGLELRPDNCVSTGPKMDNPQCHASGCNPPDMQTFMMDNVNKILVIDYESKSLIACGSLFQGACQKYNLSNITAQPQFFPVAVAANDEQSSTFAFIGPYHYSVWGVTSRALYVGTTYTTNGEYRLDVPAIASRSLHNFELALSSFLKQSMLKIDVKYLDHFLVNYVYGFHAGEYVYFTTTQRKSHLPGEEEMGYISRIGRVCISDGNFDTYTEITLKCDPPGEIGNFNLIRDAKLTASSQGQLYLLASFSPSVGFTSEAQLRSSVCAYHIAEIEGKFAENARACLNGTIMYRNMDYVSGNILEGHCPKAANPGSMNNLCGEGLRLSGPYSLVGKSHFYVANKQVTALITDHVESAILCHMGTSDGTLIKAAIYPNDSAIYEHVLVDPGSTILPDSTFGLTTQFIYVLTRTKVSKVSAYNCSVYTDCAKCLDSRDPYCGWCSLEKKCTIRSSCTHDSKNQNRWLSVSAGHQCIDFESIVPDRIPITESAELTLQVRSLPDLPTGTHYRCVFGGKDLMQPAKFISDGLSCNAPPVEYRPRIPPGKDHVLVALSVRSSETNKDFVSRNFAYFNCSVHNSCLDCVKSKWTCSWCVNQSKCTHNASSCQDTVVAGDNVSRTSKSQRKGEFWCPRIVDVLEPKRIPFNMATMVTVEVKNLPFISSQQSGYLCSITIENSKTISPAKVNSDNTMISCEKTLYAYQEATNEYHATLTILWNFNNIIDSINLTVYKCEVIGSNKGVPDCSLCVTSDADYRCTWCNNKCTFANLCHSHSHSKNGCPKPRIDTVGPLVGPVEGGTLITIEGGNFGFKEEHVKNKIKIGDIACVLVEYQVSIRIKCRTGPAHEPHSANIVVGNTVGFTESAAPFTYERVRVDSLSPSVGPVSGGTLMRITGEHLDIGSTIYAYLDDLPCTVLPSASKSDSIVCVTSPVSEPRIIKQVMVMIDDSKNYIRNSPFKYKADPVIGEISPLMSFASGGRIVTVRGTNLDIVQSPKMVVYIGADYKNYVNMTDCDVLSPIVMECPSPAVNQQFALALQKSHYRWDRRKRSGVNDRRERNAQYEYMTINFGFQMDKAVAVQDLKRQRPDLAFVYVQDPVFAAFANGVLSLNFGDGLVIEGENLNLACEESDITVTVGTEICNITTFSASQLICNPPLSPTSTHFTGVETENGYPAVYVHYGKTLKFHLGYLQCTDQSSSLWSNYQEVLVFFVAFVVLLMAVICAMIAFYRKKSNKAKLNYDLIQMQMDTLEKSVRSECKQAFAELQTDMTDLTSVLQVSGIPVWDRNTYVFKVFFPGVKDHPINTPETILSAASTYNAAMEHFESMVYDDVFLLNFLATLEAQPSFDIRDKVNVASLLSVIFLKKMDYGTAFLRELLNRLIQKNANLMDAEMMLRRTESVTEKLVGNWIAVCMYQYLLDNAAPSLYVMCNALKHQLEKGPIDAKTHKARYAINEAYLLRDQIDHNVVTLIVESSGRRDLQCKVLDCDTIGQVKSKIMDTVYKNIPFTMRPPVSTLELEHVADDGSMRRILRDFDESTKAVSGWKRINTLSHYGIIESAVVALVEKNDGQDMYQRSDYVASYYTSNLTSAPSTSKRTRTRASATNKRKTEQNQKIYHLEKCAELTHGDKPIPEAFLTQLVFSKGTLSKFVGDFFDAIVNIDTSFPIAIKWLFDIFDDAAAKYNISEEVVHAWKSNSLPLRFWANLIRNPDFIFDIDKSASVDPNLTVIASVLMEACTYRPIQLVRDSPSTKLLFNKEIPCFREKIKIYYENIRAMPNVTDEEMFRAMRRLSRTQSASTKFNKMTALKELYIYMSKYNQELAFLHISPPIILEA